ncbi:hypothetical protein O7635_31500 [Asanoa sp. WMMD1127]|uniref:hypothetical protein n=1 Tax=Asanoa sp. WMMD1127 TaxID=3016107 RepID=UPI002417B7EB|nr:hypothetical protein [Asanoa sp. WMMD1127]MDG4826399.1 hypothetical protein [Asanoa sp. WMMD1127]
MRRFLAVPLLTGALLLAACSDTADSAAPSATSPSASAAAPSPTAPAPDTRDDLTVVKEAFDRSFAARKFGMSVEISAGGTHVAKIDASLDLEADALRMTMMTDEYQQLLKIGDEIFIKNADEDVFVRVEVGKLRPGSPLGGSFDLTQHSGILGGVVAARKVEEKIGTRIYEGTADLRKAVAAAPPESRKSMEATLRLARDAEAVPFRLIADDEGRLTSLAYEIETAQGGVRTLIRMNNRGAAAPLQRPEPDQVKDATAEQYAVL